MNRPELSNSVGVLQDSTRPVVFMPWLGEFGVMIGYWIRYVHRYRAAPKIVCCRAGDEALYPSATHFVQDYTDPVPDRKKRNSCHKYNGNEVNEELKKRLAGVFGSGIHYEYPRSERLSARDHKDAFPIQPVRRRGLSAEIAMGCRRRDYKAERNWNHWDWLAEQLVGRGHRVGIVGRQETSFDPPAACIRAWEGGNDTDANIELLQSCRLFVGSDTGSSHLAAFCSIPSVLFRYPDRWPGIGLMQRTTTAKSQVLENGWDHPEEVLAAVLNELGQMSLAEEGKYLK